MAIELITGALGSGKTTFMVAKRLTEEQGRPFEYEDANGTMRPAKRRLVVAGIDKLLVEHERLPHTLTGDVVRKKDIEFWNQEDENGEPLFKRLPEDPPVEFVLDAKGCRRDVEASLFNWWLWVLPGDLIVCDEIQYIVPRGTMGRQPPHYIKMMEFSRHYGADFLFGTQHPQLLDMTIRNLVNPHRHVRSVMGSSLCTIYVWDHASNPERITLSTKTFFRRKREHYKLFKSTKAVMKQPSAGRGWLMLVPVLLLVSGFMFYRAFTKHGVDAVPVASAMAQGVPVAQSGWRSDPRLGLVPEKVSGCFMVGPKCSCLDGDFQPIRVTAELCKQSASSYSGLVKWRPRDALPAAAMQAGAAAKPADLSAFNPFKAASSPGA